jgi:hypothetical protein
MTEFEALLLSAVIEGPIAFVLVRSMRWPCRGPLHVAAAVMLATAVTHPQLWSASLWLYPRIGYWPTMGCTEAAVIVVEAAIIGWVTGLSPTRALIASGIANLASALTGVVLFW